MGAQLCAYPALPALTRPLPPSSPPPSSPSPRTSLLPLKCSEPSECFHRQVGRTPPPPPKCCHLLSLRPSFASGLVGCAMDGGGRARVVPGSHTSFSLPSFLSSASHSLSLFSLLAAFSSLPISNEKRKQFKAPAHPPSPDKSVVLPCTFPAFPRKGGREGYCTFAFGGTLRRLDARLEFLVDCARTNTTTF